MKSFPLTLALGLAAMSSTPIHAQLFVDYGGARNIFFSSSAGGGDAGFTKLDTNEKSVSLNLWALNQASAWRFGGAGKASATDDISEILNGKKAPRLEGSAIANWTSTPAEKDTWLYSVTIRSAASEASYSLLTPAATKPVDSKFQAVEGSVTFAAVPIRPGGKGGLISRAFALSVGAKKTTNYEDLALVDVGNGKSARKGNLEKFTSYPVQLMFVQEIKVEKGGAVEDAINILRLLIPVIDKDARKWLLLSPYVKALPRSGGISQRAFGLNLAVKTMTSPDKDNPAKDVLKFPLSVFFESVKKAGADTFVTQGGASIILTSF
jgi:hypothetical protein